MDPILVANLKAAAASDKGQKLSARSSYEKGKLREQRRKRGELVFLERMEADATSKKAFDQVCTLRANPGHRAALDRAINRMQPAAELKGPRVVTHDSKLLYEGQDRKCYWAPLECY